MASSFLFDFEKLLKLLENMNNWMEKGGESPWRLGFRAVRTFEEPDKTMKDRLQNVPETRDCFDTKTVSSWTMVSPSTAFSIVI